MVRAFAVCLVVLVACVLTAPTYAQSEDDRYSIMRPEPGSEPWLPPKYKSPRGTRQRPVTSERIPEPQQRTTTVPPPLYVPQTGQVLPNTPTVNGAGPRGAETSQDRAVRCAHQAGAYGSAAGDPSAYVGSCINQ